MLLVDGVTSPVLRREAKRISRRSKWTVVYGARSHKSIEEHLTVAHPRLEVWIPAEDEAELLLNVARVGSAHESIPLEGARRHASSTREARQVRDCVECPGALVSAAKGVRRGYMRLVGTPSMRGRAIMVLTCPD